MQRAVRDELKRAAHERDHGWHLPVPATAGSDGPDARTVVLREVDAGARTLLVFSDARAAKLTQIDALPRGMLVFWSPALGWQLRCRVAPAAHTDGLAVTSRRARLRDSRAAQDRRHAPPARR